MIKLQDFDLARVKDTAFKLEDDPYYNLFDGGYIDPEDLLNDKDKALAVRNAIELVREYIDLATTVADNLEEEE
jgi:hypothetical protein